MKQLGIGICLVLLSVSAFAHPHMALDSTLEFEYQGVNCTGFWVNWVFDAYFSSAIIQEQDTDGNRKFSAKEIQGVYNGAFINLRKYGYFTYIRTGSRRINPDRVEQFSAAIQGDRMSYRFFVPLAGKGLGKDFYVAIFDSTFYCNCSNAKDAASVTQSDTASPAPVLDRAVNKAFPVYYNPQGSATDFTIYTKWKPGLETAYPEEIHVRLPL